MPREDVTTTQLIWPGKKTLTEAIPLHNLCSRRAKVALNAALKKHKIDMNIGGHKKHEHTVVVQLPSSI